MLLKDLSRQLNVDVGTMKMSLRQPYLNVIQSGAGQPVADPALLENTIDVSWILACNQDVSLILDFE